ncbi:MAG: hypothetical protein B7Z02_07120 [Rhodobacterales bacterium 32-67-9]|nr:MAG: hypothetical protein B7Z02_07120 [Rhodobacterales bacterium 32-67-9]
MTTTRAIVFAAIAAALGAGIYYVRRGPDPVVPIAAPADQQGMSGMSGMTGDPDPACTRYDLIEGAWVCTATTTGSGS